MNIRLCLFSFLSLLGSGFLFATAPEESPTADLTAWNRGHPGGVSVVLVDARGPRFFSTGQFSKDDPRTLTPDTFFEIGSFTKVFTALLLAQEERDGLVKENDSVADLLLPPGDPEKASLKEITLLSLATHASGLPRLPSNMRTAADKDPYSTYSRADLLEALRADGKARGPGNATAYSNFGVALLGEALAAADKRTYAVALDSRVLQPLGLKRTRLSLKGVTPNEDLAPGHRDGAKVANWTFDAMAPAGGLLSSARELGIFLQACLGFADTPATPAIRSSIRPRGVSTDIEGQIGLIWRITGAPGSQIVWHNGMTGGYASFVGFDPVARRGVAVLTNHAESVDRLGFQLLGAAVPKAPDASVSNASDFVGRYPLAPGFNLDVTERDSALFVQATGQEKLELQPLGTDRFSIKGVPAEISFARDGKGRVESATLHQNGRSTPGKREPLPVTPKAIVLADDLLEEYAGTYSLAPNADFVVVHEPGALWAKLGGQQRFRVYPSAKDEFFYKAVEARLSFVRDGGRITGLVLHQGGQNLAAKRKE